MRYKCPLFRSAMAACLTVRKWG